MTPGQLQLVGVLLETRKFLARPHNDFAWSHWNDAPHAIQEIDTLINRIEAGDMPDRLDISILFAPTGPIQEVSETSGWGRDFLDLSTRFDTTALALAYNC